jgi:protein kinase C substrate 80K-H
MHSLLFFLSLANTLVFAAGVSQIHGVHPSLLSRYKPKGSIWSCLDGAKTIPWSAVNDDFCDCLDGSDEPGALFRAVISLRSLTSLLRNECVSR